MIKLLDSVVNMSIVKRRIKVFLLCAVGMFATFTASAQQSTDDYLNALTNQANAIIHQLGNFTAHLDSITNQLSSTTNNTDEIQRDVVTLKALLTTIDSSLSTIKTVLGPVRSGHDITWFLSNFQLNLVNLKNELSALRTAFDTFVDTIFPEAMASVEQLVYECRTWLSDIYDRLDILNDTYSLLENWYDDWGIQSFTINNYWRNLSNDLAEIKLYFGGGGGDGGSDNVRDILNEIADQQVVTNDLERLFRKYFLFAFPKLDSTTFTAWDIYTHVFPEWTNALAVTSQDYLDEYDDNKSYFENSAVAFNNMTKLLQQCNEGISRIVYILKPQTNDAEEVLNNALESTTNEYAEVEKNVLSVFDDLDFLGKYNRIKNFLINSVKTTFSDLIGTGEDSPSKEDYAFIVSGYSFLGFDVETQLIDFYWIHDLVPFFRYCSSLLWFLVLAWVTWELLVLGVSVVGWIYKRFIELFGGGSSDSD